jgi:methylphosphotriester-DNA--protein-cysteine methyltransferase
MKKLSLATLLLVVSVAASAFGPDDIVYGTKTGERYHLEKCSSLRKSKIKMTVKEAVQKGLTPCQRCKPPKMIAQPNRQAA